MKNSKFGSFVFQKEEKEEIQHIRAVSAQTTSGQSCRTVATSRKEHWCRGAQERKEMYFLLNPYLQYLNIGQVYDFLKIT